MPIVKLFKGNNSCTSYAILMKLYVHSRIMMIHMHFKVHELTMISYLVTAHFIGFQSFQRASLTKLYVHHLFIVIHIFISFVKFHSVGSKLWLQTYKINQFKGNNSMAT